MNTHRTPDKGGSISFIFWLIVAGCLLNMALLVSFELHSWPWDVQWLAQGRVTDAVWSAIGLVRYELAGVLLIALNFVLLVLRQEAIRTVSEMEPRSDAPADRKDISTGSSITITSSDSVSPDHALSTDDLKDSQSNAAELVGQGLVPACSVPGVVRTEAVPQSVSESRTTANLEAQMHIATDEIARLRRELVSCKQQLATANKTKAQFLANMSHELRTPMNGIVGMTELLLSGSLTAREQRFVTSISSSASTLLSIISDLLDFSKIESGALQLEKGRFSVHDCVEDVSNSLAAKAHAKGIELICYVDDNVSKQMDGDSARIRQILNNLINNAIAFTEEGEVVVRLTRKSDAKDKSVYQCDVQDTGAGISPELQVQLFEAFTQADNSNTRSHGGLGMGLAIASQLVSLMNGQISFRSRLGEGSRFSFTMELEDVANVQDPQSRRRTMQGARALVVDDNETNRTVLFHQLSNWGLLVETVESGALALNCLRAAHDRQEAFDVLILDLHMPEMDGIQLAKALQVDADFRHIPSIMLTSAVLHLDARELRRLGIYKYISKPARQSVLHDSLASVMPTENGQRHLPEHDLPSDADSLPLVNARVLLVEDNPVNQDVAMGMLEQLGCQVSLAIDGAEAVSKGAEEKFDIVLMDCQMPLMDGYEATRRIKSGDSINAPTPIVALTANAMDGDREKCLMAGMDDYVSKPVRTQILSHMLEKWVGKPLELFDQSSHSRTPAIVASGLRDDDLPEDFIEGVDGDHNGHDVCLPAVQSATHEHALSDEPVAEKEQASVHEIVSTVTDSGVTEEHKAPGVDLTQVAAVVQEDNVMCGQADTPASDTHDEEEPEESLDIINLKAINVIRGLQRPGKPDLLGKVVAVYFDKTPEVISNMRTGLESQDYTLISASAHSLKSSSAYLGAEALSKHCRAIESAIAADSHDDLEALITAIAENYEQSAIVLKELIGVSDKAA